LSELIRGETSMVRTSKWIATFGLALVVGFAGCGGSETPTSTEGAGIGGSSPDPVVNLKLDQKEEEAPKAEEKPAEVPKAEEKPAEAPKADAPKLESPK
jgi:hypothetical protein